MNARKLGLLAGAGMLSFLAFAAATCGSTTTNIEGGNQPHGITVSGEGRATAKPDVAQITLGASALVDSVADARDRAAASMDALIKSMKDDGVADKDIHTRQLTISPEYDYSNGRQSLRGFRVTNTVTAKIRDIDTTSKVIDDAVRAGGNDTQIQGISFTIDKPEDLKKQAREAAIADARAKAETLAKASGVSLGDAIAISENAAPTPTVFAAGLAEKATAGAPSTPIQPGELDVTVDVAVTWAIK